MWSGGESPGVSDSALPLSVWDISPLSLNNHGRNDCGSCRGSQNDNDNDEVNGSL